MNHSRTNWLAFALAYVLAIISIGSASAHGNHSSPIQNFTQMVGPYEISLTIEIPPTAPAPINIDVVVPTDIGAATVTMRATPRGQAFTDTNRTIVQTAAEGEQPIYNTTLAIDRTGDWEIELQASGAQGQGVARIPFSVVPTPLPPYSLPLIIAIATLIVLMLISIIMAAIANNRRTKSPAWLTWLIGRGIFAALITAIIFGALELNDSTAQAQANATGITYMPAGTLLSNSGRPHVNMALTTTPAAPRIGERVTLNMSLTDGGTGLPADDIVPHHDALLHLALINEDGSFFLHTHPARRSPGSYAIDVIPTRPGRYTAYAEIERIDSGTQVLRGTFSVSGDAEAVPLAPGFGTRTIGNLQVTVDGSQNPVVAGTQTTLTFSFRNRQSQPVRDLHPWLGMAGHMMASSADGTMFAHIHAAETMPPYGRPMLVNGTIYGPDIRFVYTFPAPGTYHVWGQFKHDGHIVTVPVTVEVAP